MLHARLVVDLISDDSDSDSDSVEVDATVARNKINLNSHREYRRKSASNVINLLGSFEKDSGVSKKTPTTVSSSSRQSVSATDLVHPLYINPCKKQKMEVIEPIVSIKKEIHAVGFGEADIPDEVVEIRNPSCIESCTPGKSVINDSNRATPVGSELKAAPPVTKASDVINLGDDDDAIEYIGGNMTVASEMPHAREACPSHVFQATSAKSSLLYCAHCYCYVCEVKSSECLEWNRHCFATYKVATWKRERAARQSKLMKLLPMSHRKTFYNNFRYVIEGQAVGGEAEWGTFTAPVTVRTEQPRNGSSLDKELSQALLKEIRTGLAQTETSEVSHSQYSLVQASILLLYMVKAFIQSRTISSQAVETSSQVLADILFSQHCSSDLRSALSQGLQSLRVAPLLNLCDVINQAMTSTDWLRGSSHGTVPSALANLADPDISAITETLLKTNSSDVLVAVAAMIRSPVARFNMVLRLVRHDDDKTCYFDYTMALLLSFTAAHWIELGKCANQLSLNSLDCWHAGYLLYCMLAVDGATELKMRIGKVAFLGCMSDSADSVLKLPRQATADSVLKLLGYFFGGASVGGKASWTDRSPVAHRILSWVCHLLLTAFPNHDSTMLSTLLLSFVSEVKDEHVLYLVDLLLRVDAGSASDDDLSPVPLSDLHTPRPTSDPEKSHPRASTAMLICCELMSLQLTMTTNMPALVKDLPVQLLLEWSRIPDSWRFGLPPQMTDLDCALCCIPHHRAAELCSALLHHKYKSPANMEGPSATHVTRSATTQEDCNLGSPLQMLWKRFISDMCKRGCERFESVVAFARAASDILTLLGVRDKPSATLFARAECPPVSHHIPIIFALIDATALGLAPGTAAFFTQFRTLMTSLHELVQEAFPTSPFTSLEPFQEALGSLPSEDAQVNMVIRFWKDVFVAVAAEKLADKPSAVYVLLQDSKYLDREFRRGEADMFTYELRYLTADDVVHPDSLTQLITTLRKIVTQHPTASVVRSLAKLVESTDADELTSILIRESPELMRDIAVLTLSPRLVKNLRKHCTVCPFDSKTSGLTAGEAQSTRSAESEAIWSSLRAMVGSSIRGTLQECRDQRRSMVMPTAPPRVYGLATSPDDALICSSLLSLDDELEDLIATNFRPEAMDQDPLTVTTLLATVQEVLLSAASVHRLLRQLELFVDVLGLLSLQERQKRNGVCVSVTLDHIVVNFNLAESMLDSTKNSVLLEFWAYYRPTLTIMKMICDPVDYRDQPLILSRMRAWLMNPKTQSCFSLPDFIELVYMFFAFPELHAVVEGLILVSAEVPVEVVRRMLILAEGDASNRQHICHMLVAWCFQSNTIPSAVRTEVEAHFGILVALSDSSVTSSLQYIQDATSSLLPIAVSVSVLRLIVSPTVAHYQDVFRHKEAFVLKEKLLGLCFNDEQPITGIRILLHERKFARLFALLNQWSSTLPSASKIVDALAEAIDIRYLRHAAYVAPLVPSSAQAEAQRTTLSIVAEVGRADSLLRLLLHYLLPLDAALTSGTEAGDEAQEQAESLRRSLENLFARIVSVCSDNEFVAKYLACGSFASLTAEHLKAVAGLLRSSPHVTDRLLVLTDVMATAAGMPAPVSVKIRLFRECLLLRDDVTFTEGGLLVEKLHQIAVDALLCPVLSPPGHIVAPGVPWLVAGLMVSAGDMDQLKETIITCGTVAASLLESPLLVCLSSSYSLAMLVLSSREWADLVAAMASVAPQLSSISGLFALRTKLSFDSYRSTADVAQTRPISHRWSTVVVYLLRRMMDELEVTAPAQDNVDVINAVSECLKIILDAKDNKTLWFSNRPTAVGLLVRLYKARAQLVVYDLCRLAPTPSFAVGPAVMSVPEIREAVSLGTRAQDLLQDHVHLAAIWASLMETGSDEVYDLMSSVVSTAVDYMDRERVTSFSRTNFTALLETVMQLFRRDASTGARWLQIISGVRRRLTRKKTVLSAIKNL